MIRSSRTLPILLALFALALAPLGAFAGTAGSDGEKGKTEAKLTIVEPRFVCMVNNALMGKEQIPVEVEGKTYYGCCEMCKGRLAQDPTSRTAVDPVTGKSVDKAKAVIAALASGDVLYFESKETLAKYQPK